MLDRMQGVIEEYSLRSSTSRWRYVTSHQQAVERSLDTIIFFLSTDEVVILLKLQYLLMLRNSPYLLRVISTSSVPFRSSDASKGIDNEKSTRHGRFGISTHNN